MITILCQDCNHISQSFYDSLLASLQFHQLTCSCGHSACLTIHGYYNRSVKLPDAVITLRICRLLCSECHATHAILPSCIVPYSQIRLADQQKICQCLDQKLSVMSVCDSNPSVDENNVKAVIRNYKKHWLEKLRALRIDLVPVTDLIRNCFALYSMQFMQIHRTRNRLFVIPT